MIKMAELISICIPTYNGEKYLQEALDSIKTQTYKNFEVIISDDESIDRTLEICQKFKKEVDFPVFIYSHSPAGIAANWNHCIEKANGDLIKFLFQDDILNKRCVEKMVFELESNNSKIVVCKRNIIVEINNSETQEWLNIFGDLQENLATIENNVITKKIFGDKKFLTAPYNKIGEPIVGLIHKDVYKKVGLYNENYKQFLDYEFWYRVLLKFDILFIEEKLVTFRFHSQQTTSINKNHRINEKPIYFDFVKNNLRYYLDKEVRKEFFPTLFERIVRKIKRFR